jgi:hypothetical protein
MASADQSVTAWPVKVWTEGRDRVAITVANTGDELETIRVASNASWLRLQKPKRLELMPGEQHQVQVDVVGTGSEGAVMFIIRPDESANGIEASGGVAIPVVLGVSPAPPVVEQKASLPWWIIFAATFPVLILVGWAIRRRHRRPRAFGF